MAIDDYLETCKTNLKYKSFEVLITKHLQAGTVSRVNLIKENAQEQPIWVCKKNNGSFVYYVNSESFLTVIAQSEKYQLIDKLSDTKIFSAILAILLLMIAAAFGIFGVKQVDPAFIGLLSLAVGFYYGKK